MDPLTKIYKTYPNEELFLTHWLEYGKHYHHYLHRFYTLAHQHNQVINMLEIGVNAGGSTRVWQKYFGAQNVRYTGLDNHAGAAQAEAKGIHIVIGSAMDPKLLASICKQYGPFDIIVDDGGHTTPLIVFALRRLWSKACLKDKAVYVIEDTHVQYVYGPGYAASPDGAQFEGRNLFRHLGEYAEGQTKYWANERRAPPDPFSKHLAGMHVHDSLVFLDWQEEWPGPYTPISAGDLRTKFQ